MCEREKVAGREKEREIIGVFSLQNVYLRDFRLIKFEDLCLTYFRLYFVTFEFFK